MNTQNDAARPVAWYDPKNTLPGQSVTFIEDTAVLWPHLYPVPLYTAADYDALKQGEG